MELSFQQDEIKSWLGSEAAAAKPRGHEDHVQFWNPRGNEMLWVHPDYLGNSNSVTWFCHTHKKTEEHKGKEEAAQGHTHWVGGRPQTPKSESTQICPQPPPLQLLRRPGRMEIMMELNPKPTKQKKHEHVDRLTGCARLFFFIDTDLKIRDSGLVLPLSCWWPLSGFQFLYLSNRRLMTSRILQLPKITLSLSFLI